MPRGEKYRSTALQNIECISFSCIICIPLKQLSLTGPTKEKVMSGYPEFSLVARRRLLPAGGTRLERGEGRGGRWGCSGSGGTRRCALATLLSNLLSSNTFPPLVLAFHQPFPRQLPNRVRVLAAFAPHRANTTFTKFRPFAGLLVWVQLIIVQNILDQGGSWRPGQPGHRGH